MRGKLLFIMFLLFLTISALLMAEVELGTNSVMVGGVVNDISWEAFKKYKDASMLIGDNNELKLDFDSAQVAENSISGIGNKTIAQAHGALLYSGGKEDPLVWDLVSLGNNGVFEFFKNTWTSSSGLSWKSMGTYNPSVSNFNGYGTGITGDFDGDGTVDYFGVSETDRQNGKALYVTDVINVKNSRRKYSISVSANSGTLKNTKGNKVNGTNGWTSTGFGKYDMDGDKDLDLVYAVRGSLFLIENKNGKFIEDGKLYNKALFDDSVLNNNSKITDASKGSAVCDIFDFNKDDIPDIIAGHTDKKGLYLYLGKEDENSSFPLYDPDEKIAIIGADGKLTENSTGSLIENGENKLAISLLRVDEDGIIYICTDNFRQNGNGGKIMKLTLDTDLSTVENPFFNCQPILDKKSNDFDHGSLGKFYPNKKDQIVIADGNNSNQFYVTKTEYKGYYKSKGKLLSEPLTDIEALGVQDEFINKVNIEIKVSKEFVELIEVDSIDGEGNTIKVKQPKATLYVNVFPERQRKDTTKYYYEDLYHHSYAVQSENIQLIEGGYIVSLEYNFDPVPYPVVSLAFESNPNIVQPDFTPIISDLKITVETGEPSLKITNISW